MSVSACRAFTLIEMLIVVVVLVTLMSITFRLMNVGDSSDRRVTTVMRLQKLENCLSGYYAAFGSYPPVPLQGSQDFNYEVTAYGIQKDKPNTITWSEDREGQKKAWQQVEPACRAQPVAARYPLSKYKNEEIDWGQETKDISDEIIERITENDDDYKILDEDEERKSVLLQGFDNLSDNPGRFGDGRVEEETDWREIQIFQFGLMSFLLPRYLFMMNGPEQFFNEKDTVAQWDGNNSLPCDPFKGGRYSDWERVKIDAERNPDETGYMQVANIPSQTACARWMPNLERLCVCNHDYRFFGIDIQHHGGLTASPYIQIYSPDKNAKSGSSGQYLLDSITVEDGWGNEFYYYSPSPYQTYTLWSAGPNGKTFPPWVSREDISDSTAKKVISTWTSDDIVHLAN